MRQRLSFLLRYYVLTVAVFMAAKVVFMICQRDSHPFALADVGQVLRHGLGLDLSTALYFLILPWLAALVSVWLPLPRWLLRVYHALVSVAYALAFVADTSLYVFWQFKLDASCLQYLATPTEAMASVSTGYLLLRLLALLLVAALLYALFAAAGCTVLRVRDQQAAPSRTVRLRRTLVFLLMAPLMVIGIRGGLDESTTNIGQVYYSQNQFLNHSAVNPVFSFLSSMSKSGDYIVSYDFYSDAECRQLTDGIFFTHGHPADTLLRTQRPNIIIVMMESCGAQFTDVGGHPEIMPRLNRLTREGVFFAECYASSWRTDRGTLSILSGYPAFPTMSVMKIPEKSRKLPSIASSLRQQGYATSFLYGGDINFTNMRSYVVGSGYEQLRWKADYSREEQSSAEWGVRDDLMFASLLDEVKNEQHDHWMKTLLTLSSHEPWDVPTQQLSDPVYNAFNYLDHCIGSFAQLLIRATSLNPSRSALWDTSSFR